MKISIIVPIYNGQIYADDCIKSIVNQSFRNFELLLINDGSADGSGEICERYAKEDSRLKVFHKENGGPSSARNLGLKMKSGKYVLFIDVDDSISNDYLEIFIRNIADNDMVMQGVIRKQSNKQLKTCRNFEKDFVLNNNEDILYFIEVLNLLYNGSVYGILFKSALLDRAGIFFDNKLKKGEDLIFVLQYILHCRTVRSMDVSNYIYDFSITDSVSKNKFTEENILHLLSYLHNLLFVTLKMKNSQYPNISEALLYIMHNGVFDVLDNLKSKKSKIQFLRAIRPPFLYSFLNNSAISFKQEIVFWILKNRLFAIYIFIYKLK